MIHGVGVDLVEIACMEEGLIRFGSRLAQKLLTDDELHEFGASVRPAQFLAVRFAAKEAFAKALGTGFRKGVYPREISVGHDALGRPELVYAQNLKAILDQRGISSSHLSLSDEQDLTLAFVVLERS